jgi:ABC-2 type transport system ATP-binding protein
MFGNFPAVDGIDFSVGKGEIFGLLGANGAGKTTTIKMICGLLSPSDGTILLDGVDVTKKPAEARKRLGYLSQKFSLYQELSPLQNLVFFSSIYKVSREQKSRALEKLRMWLGDAAANPVSELPLGFKQRVGLVCSMVHNPPFLILDEPTSGVDAIGRQEFWEEIYRQKKEGKSILVTTHYMQEAEYCDRLAVMHRGKVLIEDRPEAVCHITSSKNLSEAFLKLMQRGA